MSAGINILTHRQKVDRLITDLHKQGVNPYTVAPPLFRLLWALGFHVPPPFFLGFLTLTLLTGAFFGIPCFGILWGALMWLLPRHLRMGFAVVTSAGAGLLFGLSMAGYYRWKAARLRLPPWESYPAAMPKILPSRKASQFWIRFWIPVVVSLGVTPFALCVGIGFAGAGHGTIFPMWILFPLWWLIFSDGLAHSNFVLFPPLIVQFPIYGIILGFANVKRKLILAACVLLWIHLSATGWLFGSYYYGIYKFKHDPNNQLEEAVRNNDVETARGLLDQGADPNTHLHSGYSLLMLSCNKGHLEIARLLIENSADINYEQRQLPHTQPTALFVSVLTNREQIVELLLSKGADVRIKDSGGCTALEFAKHWRDFRLNDKQSEYTAEERARDERIISLLEAAAKDQKKP